MMHPTIARRPVAQRLREWLIARCLAPINLDGRQVQDITIDGDSVSQVTMDGQQVFDDAIPDSGLAHQYDATEITANDSDAVTAWANQEGGDDLTAGTAPTYKTSIIGGNAVVRHDGTNEYLTASFSSTVTAPYHIFMVAQLTATNSGSFNYALDGGSSNDLAYREDDGPNFDWGGLNVTSSDTTAHIHTLLADGANSTVRIDGTQEATGDSGVSDLTGLSTGARPDGVLHGPWDIGEILIYSQQLSDSDRDSVESYLADKWEIIL